MLHLKGLGVYITIEAEVSFLAVGRGRRYLAQGSPQAVAITVRTAGWNFRFWKQKSGKEAAAI
jgi:acyl-coenzyme A thioesterase PaaI-like protein